MDHTILHKKFLGFSLMELMLVLAITSILIGAAVPSYLVYIANSRGAELAVQLSSALRLAKSEAQYRGVPVKLCALATNSAIPRLSAAGTCNDSASSWANGWQVVVPGNNQLIYFNQPQYANFININPASSIIFLPSGIPKPYAATFTIKPTGCTIGYIVSFSALAAGSGIQLIKTTCP